MTGLLVILLIAFVIYLERRLARLERAVDEIHTVAPHYGEWIETPPVAEPAVAEVAGDPAPLPEQAGFDEPAPAQAVLYAEQRRDDRLAIEPEPDEPRRPAFAFSFEDLLGRRLPIWAGGITLAVAGIFIVKLSIEAGLLSPPVRVIGGLIFGAVLIGGAELALRYHERVGDARVRQALSGAGIATLYASILVAANLYHLIPALIAMLGIAGVTGAAMFLSIRFGAPSALLGLAGGLAAPALIGSDEPNVPLLSVYLALAVAGLCTLSRNRRWAWLGISALVGGFGWGLVLLVGGALDAPSRISVGLYLLLLGVGIPALGFAGSRQGQLQLIAGIAAAAQMAVLVATGGFALLNWGLFAMLAIASLWLGQRNPSLVRLPPVGLLVALLLLGAWPAPQMADFALVLAGVVLIYGMPAAWRLWRSSGGLVEAGQLAALGLGTLFLSMFHFHRPDGSIDLQFGLLALASFAAVAASAAVGWRNPGRRGDARFAILSTAAAILLAAAAILLLPAWAHGFAIASIGLAVLHLGQVAEDRRLEPIAWAFAATAVIVDQYADLARAAPYPEAIRALRWTLLAGIATLFAWRARFRFGRAIAQFVAPLFLTVGISVIAPDRIDPLIPSALLLGLAVAGRGLAQERLVPAMASSALLVLYWAASPLLWWSFGATESLFGTPLLLSAVPDPATAATRLLIPGLLTGVAVFAAGRRLRSYERVVGVSLATVLAIIGTHSLYKQVFAIGSPAAFVSFGLAERTVWELVLASLAAVALRFDRKWLALALGIAAAAHLGFYTLLVHNPLWAAQAVGGWPIANLLLPVYGLAFALMLAARQLLASDAKRVIAVVQMALIALFAFSTLRQLFHGTLLVEPGLPDVENILRSIAAIALAIGFLLWGIARGERDWRIASLVLMLGAVGKVFLFDASGLEGLARIASFIALGLSLIGLGWLYARHLGVDRPLEKAAAA